MLYLVKWKNLPYAEATWETRAELKDDVAISRYEVINTPSKEELKICSAAVSAIIAGRARGSWLKLDTSPTYKNGNVLRTYQLEGLNWLTWCWYNRINSILADEVCFFA